MWHDVEQNGPEWELLKLGKASSLSYAKFMANFGKPFGEPAHRYACKSRWSGLPSARPNTASRMTTWSAATSRSGARMLYEEMFFCEVGNGGFFDFGQYGDSPDGLIGTDGVIEIKSVIASTHHDTIKRGKFDPAYKWQVAGHFDSGRKWVDFVSYCADTPSGTSLS